MEIKQRAHRKNLKKYLTPSLKKCEMQFTG